MDERGTNQEAKAELGRRILAALMSYQLHLKSVDYTMKTYLSDKAVDPSWGELGWTPRDDEQRHGRARLGACCKKLNCQDSVGERETSTADPDEKESL